MTKVTRLTLDSEGGLDRKRIHLREISDEMDAPLDTVGQDLRTARLRRGDDLATVSRALKIRKDHLEALEEDRIEALPGRTYAVGFIRSYADYLGLDAVQCVERFKAEIAGRSDATVQPITVIDEDDAPRMPHGWKIMAGVVVLLVLYGAYQLAASADKMMNEPAVQPAPTMARPVAHKPVKQAEAPAAVAPAATTPTSQDITAQLPGTPVNAENAQQDDGWKPINPAPAPAATPAVAALPPIPEGHVYGESNKNSRVVLRVRETTKILILGPSKSGDKPQVFINRILKPGDVYRLPNFAGMTLTTPNAGAVEVTLDGTSMGLAGHSAEVTEALSLDPQSIMDRSNGNHH